MTLWDVIFPASVGLQVPNFTLRAIKQSKNAQKTFIFNFIFVYFLIFEKNIQTV